MAVDYQLDIMTAAVGWFWRYAADQWRYLSAAFRARRLATSALRGCNARSLNIAASDNRPLLCDRQRRRPAGGAGEITELPLLMGERFEVLVDISDGKAADLVTPAGQPDRDGDRSV